MLPSPPRDPPLMYALRLPSKHETRTKDNTQQQIEAAIAKAHFLSTSEANAFLIVVTLDRTTLRFFATGSSIAPSASSGTQAGPFLFTQ